MKRTILSGLIGLMMASTAPATLVNFSGGAIPDASLGGAVGVKFEGNVSSVGRIADVNVVLNITGGYNGDLYSYLVSPNGTMVVLLDRVGSSTVLGGFDGSGFHVTLDDSAANSVQTSQGVSEVPLSGVFQSAAALSAFNGGNMNGLWTLYFQDLSDGEASTLVNWQLDLTSTPFAVVPEASNGGFISAAALLAFSGIQTCRRRRSSCHRCL